MLKSSLFVCLFLFYGFLSAQINTQDFVLSLEEDTSGVVAIHVEPIDNSGVVGAQTGVTYIWSFDYSAGKRTEIYPTAVFYASSDSIHEFTICMHAFVPQDSANNNITICKDLGYDSLNNALHNFNNNVVYYQDKNSNCNRDIGERVIKLPVYLIGRDFDNGYFSGKTLSDTFHYMLRKDTYDIYPRSSAVSLSNCSKNYLISDSMHESDVQEIPISINGSERDIKVGIFKAGFWNPGYDGRFYLSVSNAGIYNTTTLVTLGLPPFISFSKSDITPDTVKTGSISWKFSLDPGEEKDFMVSLFIPSSKYTKSDTLIFNLYSDSITFDYDSADNLAAATVPLNGSFDPNDKLVSSSHPLNSDYPVEYTIHFQNTGTDYARNIYVRDSLPPEADPESFNLLLSSDPVQVQRIGNVLNFSFRDIMLADTSVHGERNLGFVKFSVRMRKVNSSKYFDSVHNRAFIYFDFNPPVSTGFATLYTEIGNNVKTVIPIITTDEFRVYPNPSNGQFTLDAGSLRNVGDISIYNQWGIIVWSGNVAGMAKDGSVPIHVNLPSGVYTVFSDNQFSARLLIINK